MSSRKKPSPKRAKKATTATKPKSVKKTFPRALAALLRARKIAVPRGLEDAPPAAYAGQPATAIAAFEKLSDADLATYAERIAVFAERQAARAKAEWEASPLIAELRRRKLPEPRQPKRVAGVSVSLRKPLSEWTDDELVDAAREWSRRAGS